MLNKKELIELRYLYELGYRYIGRHEIGTVKVFKEKPVRDKVVNNPNRGGYDTWVIGKYPIKDHSLYHDVKLGNYEMITWENGVVKIDSLIEI